MDTPTSGFKSKGQEMSPSVSVQLRPDQPIAPIVAMGVNNNTRKTLRPRRRAAKNQLPPEEVRNLSQKIQAADEHWQELIDAHNKRLADSSKANDLIMLAALACFIHAVVDDKNLCGQFLKDIDKQIRKEKSRSSKVLS